MQLFRFGIIALARAHSQFRTLRRTDGNAPKITIRRFVIRIVLQQVLRSDFGGDAIKNRGQLNFVFGHKRGAAGGVGNPLQALFGPRSPGIQPQRLAAGLIE